MKIVIPGGSGQVGTVLSRAFARDGHDVVVLSRRPVSQPWRTVVWDGTTVAEWARELEGADAVINLAGRSVNCRYNAANRREILDSRVLSTRAVGDAIARCARPPRVWLQASTATIYAHRYDTANDERTGILGGDEPGAPDAWRFSIDVARAWEAAFRDAAVTGTRKVALRSAITMSPDAGGPFDTLLGLVRCGLGGPAGDGRQFVSWVHHDDFTRAVRWLIERDGFDGVVNIAAPEPLPNADFMRELRQAWGMPVGLPSSGWMLDLGAAMMRTETELILKSRRVVPTRLLDAGFEFRYTRWTDAARALVGARRGG
ncbi:MAG TPA: TIGR01777 family oxidoreductase [Vicinamibacterales bacterium]|nr:TIGR01777 family oxidoreductase [Vicinamibacterales bacterium]